MTRNRYNTGRALRKDPSGITSDRYQYIGLDQAEPSLGDPLVGISSILYNPSGVSTETSNSGTYVLVTKAGDPKRYWIDPFYLDTDWGLSFQFGPCLFC